MLIANAVVERERVVDNFEFKWQIGYREPQMMKTYFLYNIAKQISETGDRGIGIMYVATNTNRLEPSFEGMAKSNPSGDVKLQFDS